METAYEELIARTREVAVLASCSAVLDWDEQTYMPKGGVEHRSRQQALLAGLRHEKATHPRVGELVDELAASDLVRDPESPTAVNIREIGRDYRRQTRLPRRLVEELAATTSLAQQEWAAARERSDFDRFRPWLSKIIGLKRREAECLADGGDLYDALLDEYEPGAKGAELASLFSALRDSVVPLVAAITASPRRPKLDVLRRSFPIDRQRILGESIASIVGFDFARGRLDTAAHPFCSGVGPGDCRITTRFDPGDFTEALFGVLHEAGHGLYDQGLDPEFHGTPMGEAVSLGVHESQSRLWENAVGRRRSFWDHVFPQARRVFHDALMDVPLDDFYFAVNRVERSPIRVQADEVTYNLHILIRFELERALISGSLDASDVPAAWNARYREDLEIEPESAAEGCLQDIHWSAGLVGYFPTYTLGNVYAAQLFERASAELGDLDVAFSRGDFSGLLGWLRARVHRQGRRYQPAALIERVTGAPVDHRPLVAALRRKYGPLYGV